MCLCFQKYSHLLEDLSGNLTVLVPSREALRNLTLSEDPFWTTRHHMPHFLRSVKVYCPPPDSVSFFPGSFSTCATYASLRQLKWIQRRNLRFESVTQLHPVLWAHKIRKNIEEKWTSYRTILYSSKFFLQANINLIQRIFVWRIKDKTSRIQSQSVQSSDQEPWCCTPFHTSIPPFFCQSSCLFS